MLWNDDGERDCPRSGVPVASRSLPRPNRSIPIDQFMDLESTATSRAIEEGRRVCILLIVLQKQVTLEMSNRPLIKVTKKPRAPWCFLLDRQNPLLLTGLRPMASIEDDASGSIDWMPPMDLVPGEDDAV